MRQFVKDNTELCIYVQRHLRTHNRHTYLCPVSRYATRSLFKVLHVLNAIAYKVYCIRQTQFWYQHGMIRIDLSNHQLFYFEVRKLNSDSDTQNTAAVVDKSYIQNT